MRFDIAIRVLIVVAALVLTGFAEDSSGCPALSVQQVVEKLVARNIERASALPAYHGTRTYKVDYSGFGGARNAEMIVDVEYTPPNGKVFSIRSQSGSKLIGDRVFKKLLEEEKTAFEPENQRRTALNDSNYGFSLLGCETTERGAAFLLSVEPKEKSKYLYRGKIWIDARDFAVQKIAAEPAKNPSFWVKQTKIEQLYKKIDDFWLPDENHTNSSIRLGGHANLTIHYQEYDWAHGGSVANGIGGSNRK